MSYWDTSALVKLFVAESDSPVFRQHASGNAGRWVTADWTRLELWSALRRKEAEGFLQNAEAGSLFADFDAGVEHGDWKVVAVSPRTHAEFERVVEFCLSRLPPLFIRTLDALHLAAASEAGEAEIVSSDKRLREAALLLGFTLFPPPPP